jgi:prefoldin subunit 5
VSATQSEAISAKIAELKKGIGSLDGQIDYLKALKNQDLSDYGQDGIGTEELEKMEEARERYHELTREAEALERAVKKISDAEARAFGADKIGLMED